jgi:uncharacterized protein YcbX
MIIGKIQQIWRHPVKSMAGEKQAAAFVSLIGIPGDRGWALREEATREVTNGKRIPLLMQCSAHYREEPAGGLDQQETIAIPNVDITFPDGTRVGSDDANVNERLSGALGKQVSLWPLQPASNKAHYRRASVVSRLSRFKLVRDQIPKLLRVGHFETGVREMFSREPNEPLPDLLQLPPEILEFTSPPGTYFDAFPIHLLTTSSLQAMTRFNPSAAWDTRRFRPNFLIETEVGIEGLVEAGWGGRSLRIGEVELKCEIPTVRCGMTTHEQADLPKDASVLRSIVKDAGQNLGIYASAITPGSAAVGDVVELIS